MALYVYSQDFPRLTAPPRGLAPSNLRDALGRYHRVWSANGTLQYRRSDFPTPPPWAVETEIGPGREPRLLEVENLRLYVYYSLSGEDAFDVWRRLSDDDGETWEDPEMSIPGGRYPFPIRDPYTEGVLTAAFVGGELHGTWQAPGDEEPGEVFTFLDDVGAPLAVQAGSFGLAVTHEEGIIWHLLTVVLSGETAPSDWRSSDNGETWERIEEA